MNVYSISIKNTNDFISVYCDYFSLNEFRCSYDRFLCFILRGSYVCIIPLNIVDHIYLNESDDPIDLNYLLEG